MKGVLFLLLFINLLWAENECEFDTKPFVKELEKKYANEIKELRNTKKYYEEYLVCKEEVLLEKSASTLLKFLYRRTSFHMDYSVQVIKKA